MQAANRAAIVSLPPPYVRPIVRGRLGHPVEFGARFSVALVNGIACVDALRWDAFHETDDLIDQCQAYRARCGAYPAKVLVRHTDQSPLAQGPLHRRRWQAQAARAPTQAQHKALVIQRQLDARACIPIEGKSGQGKGVYGLARITARRADTSQAWIRAIFLVMNLIALQHRLFWACILDRWHRQGTYLTYYIGPGSVRADSDVARFTRSLTAAGFE